MSPWGQIDKERTVTEIQKEINDGSRFLESMSGVGPGCSEVATMIRKVKEFDERIQKYEADNQLLRQQLHALNERVEWLNHVIEMTKQVARREGRVERVGWIRDVVNTESVIRTLEMTKQ